MRARCLPAVELIGEKWAFLILRGAFNGLQHFEEFQAGLGIARNILSDRLSKLVAGGILERWPDPEDKRRVIYSLSEKGAELLPVLLALRQWGEEWGYGKMEIVLADRRDMKPVRKMCVQSHDGREFGWAISPGLTATAGALSSGPRPNSLHSIARM